MTSRSRILLTALVLCHLLLGPGLLTTRLRLHASALQPAGEEVTLRAREQEKTGDIYHLRGDVEIDYRDLIFRGDEATYHSDTGDVEASGHLLLDGGPNNEHIEADHGTYNLNTDKGRLYSVHGTIGVQLRRQNLVLTSPNPFSFTGREAELEGRDKIIVHHGTITSCQLPEPKWQLHTRKAVVVPGKDAKTYQTAFVLWRVPVFYFPYVDHSTTRKARKSGLLMPHIGNSSIKGTIFGDGFYWAINRSFDALVGGELYSKRGQGERVNIRGIPTDGSYVNFRLYSVQDKLNQGGAEARFNGEARMPFGFRGVADVDYLNSLLFREVFAETFWQAINTEVHSTAFLSRSDRGYSLNLMANRYTNYWSTTPGDIIKLEHAPSLESSSVEHSIRDSRLFWSYDVALDGLSRSELGFRTGEVGRFDAYPHLSAPFQWHGWSLRPEIAARETFYSKELSASGVVGEPLSQFVNRNAFETSFALRPPAVSRVFDKPVFGRTIKHTLEPRMVYRYVGGVGDFDNIIRFDERDILSNTNEVEYALTNRIYVKNAPKKDCDATPTPERKPESVLTPSFSGDEDFGMQSMQSLGTVREPSLPGVRPPATVALAQSDCSNPSSYEFLSWDLAQKYYFDPTFGGALTNGVRNVFSSTVDLTGLAFLTGQRQFSPIVSRLLIRHGSTDIQWNLDYDTRRGQINGSTVFVNQRLSKDFSFGAGHTFLHTPGEVQLSTTLPSVPEFNQFRLQLQYGAPNRRGLNAAAIAGYDAAQHLLQYSAYQTSYNWDCCGFTFELRRFALGSVRDENEYRFSLSLTNVGSFGNLRKQERLY